MRADAAALARRRDNLWQALRPTLANTPALTRHASAPTPAEIEPVDPAAMRGDVGAWNSMGIGQVEALAAAEEAEAGGPGVVRDGVVAGLSTGTGDARGLFLVSAAERARYVGQIVAKLLPWHAPVTGARIALVLRADSQLYRDARRGRFAFLHLPLGMAIGDMTAALDRFAPTVIVAPPRELAALARAGRPLPNSVGRLFWGSESMASVERSSITDTLGLRPDPIYQATEGFIGAACTRGMLHLNDDSLVIDLEPVAGTDAFRPIVTDLRRRVQPIVRVRLDDLVRPAICGCGTAARAVEPVPGRGVDMWRIPGGVMTPEQVDDHFARALPPHAQWRAGGGPERVALELVDAAHAPAMRRAAQALLPGADVQVTIVAEIGGAKRRRVTWTGEGR